MKNLLLTFISLTAFPLLANPIPVEVPSAIPIAENVPTALPVEVLPPAPEPVEDILRLQIFLDTQLFGPGKLDGRPGEFTTKALQRYQRSKAIPETEHTAHTLDLSSVGEIYTTYTIREEDLKFVGDYPSKPAAQSKKKYLPYASLLEFLEERFHSSPDLLAFINQPLKMSTLKPGDTVKVPNVQPFLIEELSVAIYPETPEFLTRTLKIDTRERILELFEGGTLLASLPITPGSGYVATPPGTWKIVNIVQMPTFRWDDSVLKYGVRSENYYQLPMGPNNPVGVMWIGLNKPGIGIHGTNQPQTIGRAASAGCMRTANWDVVRLSKMLTKGMTVVIEGPKAIPRPVIATKTPPRTVEPPIQAEDSKKKFKWFWQR
ncbi:murein L,D-transpeptidase [Phragmitibacter flavus]|uniref:Murein L,D-transpeptidase n=1 Tax=Phragmitibacter flavus TaxID=2576071 RepID=A0A5R8KCN1_9BACT|nr:L,D-transpeptidase family protein [Phragmitibacter flavus]TLD70051.1 murein L,D-transpeptidase [Phragmitibacter flavus]